MLIDAITNHADLFTPIYDKLRAAKTRFVILYGGASSSKSYSAHQNEILNLLEYDSGDTLFIRKYGTDLYDSCYTLCKNIANYFEITQVFKWAYSNAKRQIENSITGKRILFRGIDDKAKLKSIVGIRRIIIEEAEQITHEDFLEINRRARGVENIQIILIFNPIDERHWIKAHFFDNDKVRGQTTIIHATYKDNINNLTADDIKQLEMLFHISPNDYRIYVDGEWGKPEVKRPYVYNFDREKHVSEKAIKRNKPIYLSIDFNLEPLVATCSHIWLDRFGHHWHTFAEIVLQIGSIEELSDVIRGTYSAYEVANMFVTGDATGRKRDIITRKNIDAWAYLDRELKLGKRLQVPRSNPGVADNRILVNAIYALHPDRKIHPDCKTLINELQFTEADADGKILKKDRTKQEQRADALDCDRYAANTWLYDFIAKPNKYRIAS